MKRGLRRQLGRKKDAETVINLTIEVNWETKTIVLLRGVEYCVIVSRDPEEFRG